MTMMNRDDMTHPIQPLGDDGHGRTRFKGNAIVQHLLDKGPFDMNDLATLGFSTEDRAQFAQLIGYSLSGYGELGHYVDNERYAAAEQMLHDPELSALEARNKVLRGTLADLRDGMRETVAALYEIHPDDLRAETR